MRPDDHIDTGAETLLWNTGLNSGECRAGGRGDGPTSGWNRMFHKRENGGGISRTTHEIRIGTRRPAEAKIIGHGRVLKPSRRSNDGGSGRPTGGLRGKIGGIADTWGGSRSRRRGRRWHGGDGSRGIRRGCRWGNSGDAVAATHEQQQEK